MVLLAWPIRVQLVRRPDPQPYGAGRDFQHHQPREGLDKAKGRALQVRRYFVCRGDY